MKTDLNDLPDFTLTGPNGWGPHYYPEKVKPQGERNLSRNPGLCDGEEVNDTGSKNADIHVRGYLLDFERQGFFDLIDSGKEHKMVSMEWSGHVYVKSWTLNGIIGIDRNPDHGQGPQWVFEYTLDFVESRNGGEQTGILGGPEDATDGSDT